MGRVRADDFKGTAIVQSTLLCYLNPSSRAPYATSLLLSSSLPSSCCQFLAEEDTEPAVLGFFNAETHQADVDAFEAAAAANKFEWRFAYSTDDAVRKHFKSTGSRVDVYKAPRFVAEKYEKAKVH